MRFHKPKHRHDKEYRALEVKVIYTGNTQEEREKCLDKALSLFKKRITKEGVLQEIKDRRYFKSKGRKRYEHIRQVKYKRYIKQLKHERKRQHRNKRKQ